MAANNDEYVTFKGYSKTEHQLITGEIVGVSMTSELRLWWFLKKEKSNVVSHVKFSNLNVINLTTGDSTAQKTTSSKNIIINKVYSLKKSSTSLLGATWRINKKDLFINKNVEFSDFKITGVAIELKGNTIINRTNFTVFLMRDYKSILSSDISSSNWTVGPSVLFSEDGTMKVSIRDTLYSKSQDRILTTFNYGSISIENGELVFKENIEKIEVFYNKKTNEKYKRINGKLKRHWEYERINVDPAPYKYRTIHEKGF